MRFRLRLAVAGETDPRRAWLAATLCRAPRKAVDYSPRRAGQPLDPLHQPRRVARREAPAQPALALVAERGARRQAQAGLDDQALGEGQRIVLPSTRKNAYMPPGGVGDAARPAAPPGAAAGCRGRRAGARPAPGTNVVGLRQRGQAGALHEHRRARGVELDQLADRATSAGGSTSQPSRQPVIRKLFEKLCATTRRSSGSAMSRKLGAQPRRRPKKMRS